MKTGQFAAAILLAPTGHLVVRFNRVEKLTTEPLVLQINIVVLQHPIDLTTRERQTHAIATDDILPTFSSADDLARNFSAGLQAKDFPAKQLRMRSKRSESRKQKQCWCNVDSHGQQILGER